MEMLRMAVGDGGGGVVRSLWRLMVSLLLLVLVPQIGQLFNFPGAAAAAGGPLLRQVPSTEVQAGTGGWVGSLVGADVPAFKDGVAVPVVGIGEVPRPSGGMDYLDYGDLLLRRHFAYFVAVTTGRRAAEARAPWDLV